MQLNYKIFYKQFGIRRLQSFLSPRLLDLFNLPRDSIIHYQTNDGQANIDTSKLWLAQYTKRIIVDYPEKLEDTLGNPKRKATILKTEIRPFHMENKRFKYMKDHFTIIKDEFSLLISNYNYLDVVYRYVDLPMTKYYKWWNTQKTIWSNVNTIANNSTRNQFIFMNVPVEMPSYSMLKIFSSKTNLSLIKVFDTPDKLAILELWKWLSIEHRDKSTLAPLELKNLNKVNLIFTNSNNKSTVINLGYLNSWIKDQENTTEFSNISQFNSGQIQKIFLKFLLVAQEGIPEVEELPTEDTEVEGSKQVDEQDVEELADDEDVNEDSYDEPIINSVPNDDLEVLDTGETNPDKLSMGFSKAKAKAVPDKILDERDSFMMQLAAIDSDIQDLESITLRRLKAKNIKTSEFTDSEIDDQTDMADSLDSEDSVIDKEEVAKLIFTDMNYEQAVIEQLDDYAEYGMLSASEYKKLSKDLEAYKSLKDPYGSKLPIVEAMVVTHEDIQIDASKTVISASENVIDKSMLHSSLQAFDVDYINKVLNKDILSMVSSIQRAGVIIKRHEVELVTSALGQYEIHVLELKPIDGVSSTIRFKIPKIDDDGTMNCGGNKYVLRKQRVDCPIRKINPYTVALTSYYGKNFVTLNQKKANNSLEWIVKHVNKTTMEDHAHITKVAPANVFDNNFPAPYIYNALASHYKSIKAGKYTLIFDHSLRINLVNNNEELLTNLETDGKVIVGLSDKSELVVVDKDNNFFTLTNNQLLPIGNIFTLLQLPEQNAPVDFTEVRIFSKTISVGVVLSYFLGFDKLLAFLDVPHRVVEGRKNQLLAADEFSIPFKDRKYIFSRKDKVASLIVGGFLDFEKEIKQYNAADFNDKDVYLNLLASKGLSALYIRELELTDKLFVDSITKSILEEMNEPTTFKGLLIRSTEMLLAYHHQDSQDMASMRVRGYERIAGTIYKELSVAIRQFKNKNISGRSKVDISPYQVWSTIMKDQSMKLVEDINPIQNLKESEIVTYVGEGGRGKDSMNRKSRAFHKNDMGIISEATVDSSDVGINTYLSANPSFKNLRGIATIGAEINPTNLVSTTALLAPGSDNDD